MLGWHTDLKQARAAARLRSSSRGKRSLQSPLRMLRRYLLGISLDEANFARRGFRAHDEQAQQHLESIGRSFLYGYLAALDDQRMDVLLNALNRLELEFRGFAFEG